MTRDEIAQFMQDTSGSHWGDEAHFQRFAANLLKAEREACAREAMRGTGQPMQTAALKVVLAERERIAAAIRARGQHD
jgi:hypothetical protein